MYKRAIKNGAKIVLDRELVKIKPITLDSPYEDFDIE